MKLELAISTMIGFTIIDVIIWYSLTIYEISYAVEIPVLLAIIFLTLLLIINIHGKGLTDFLEEKKSKLYRNGISYKRIKLRLIPYERIKRLDYDVKRFFGEKNILKYSRKKLK